MFLKKAGMNKSLENSTCIIIRVDCDSTIGYGHLMRMFALADMLRDDFKITFAITRPDKRLKDTITLYAHHIIDLPVNFSTVSPDIGIKREEMPFDLEKYLSGNEIVVTDGYRFGTQYQKEVMKTGAKLVCIDDFAEGYFYADAVINHAPGMNLSQYNGEPYTKFYMGLNYAMLRKEFFRPFSELRKEKSVLISFGGSDQYGLTLKALEAISSSDSFSEIHLLVSSLFSNELRSRLNEFAKKQSHKINLHCDLAPSSLVNLIDSCSFAIVSASTILVECYCRGLICFTGYYTENQKNMYNGFLKENLAFGLGDLNKVDFDLVLLNIRTFKIHRESYPLDSLSNIRTIFQRFKNSSGCVLRPARISDCKLIFDWANDPEVRENSITMNRIDWADHQKWYKKKVGSRETKIYILEELKKPVGQIRFEYENDMWKIGYSISKGYRGKGLGKKIVLEGLKKFPESSGFLAFVKPSNLASVHIFNSLAFKNSGIEIIEGEKLIKFIK
jgi:UDP-2,4-diacetamido-2,4,6-trideoxy-beta-L-altropyranose hydrolase